MNDSHTSLRSRQLALALAAALLVLTTAGCSTILASRDSAEEGAGTSASAPAVMTDAAPPAHGTAGQLAEKSQDGYAAEESIAYSGDASAPDRAGAQEQLLVRVASMRLRVKDVEATLTRIRDTVADFRGQIDDLQITSETGQAVYRDGDPSVSSMEATPLGAYVTVRVPSERLAAFSKKIATFGRVLSESASQSDVTQQHIDLAARLKNLRAEEARLRQFLDEAKNVKEMLLVETELSRVRGEIEAMQSQLDYLDKQIAYGTLTIELQKPEPVVDPADTDWGFADAVRQGIRGAAAALSTVITLFIALSPIIVLVVLVVLVVGWFVRRHRRRAAAAADSGGAGDPALSEDSTDDGGEVPGSAE